MRAVVILAVQQTISDLSFSLSVALPVSTSFVVERERQRVREREREIAYKRTRGDSGDVLDVAVDVENKSAIITMAPHH